MADQDGGGRALSLRALRRSEVIQLAVGENDTARVLFSPGGNLVAQGAPGGYYSAIWFANGPIGMEMKVSDAGALVYTSQATPFAPTAARWPATTRYMVPVSRVAASASLVFRSGDSVFAEFFVTPTPGMQLCDTAGVGWRYLMNAGGTGFQALTSVTAAAQAASIGNPAWFRADGRTTIGSGRGHGGSLRVASYAAALEVRWNALATYITLASPSGALWNLQPALTTGTLTVTAG